MTGPDVLLKRALPAVLAALALTAAPAAEAKDYYFPSVRVEVAVERDGSFLVDEYRTFEFEGRFKFAYIVIPLRVEWRGVRREYGIFELTVTAITPDFASVGSGTSISLWNC